jgi:hypothetical protein
MDYFKLSVSLSSRIGATASMRGAYVQLTGHKRKVVSSDGRTEYHDQQHDVLRVVLKESKKAYAIDVTSAQYGYYNPVTPWDDFAKTRVAGYNNLSFTKEEKRTAFDIQYRQQPSPFYVSP